jgi:hypothetical protein
LLGRKGATEDQTVAQAGQTVADGTLAGAFAGAFENHRADIAAGRLDADRFNKPDPVPTISFAQLEENSDSNSNSTSYTAGRSGGDLQADSQADLEAGLEGMNLGSTYSINWTNLYEGFQGKLYRKCVLFHDESCIFDDNWGVLLW